MKPIRVGLLGIGTVGGGTWEVLNRNADEIRRRAGRAIRIAAVADKAVERARKIVGKRARVIDDAFVSRDHLRVEEVKLSGYEAGGARVFETVAQGWYLLAGGSKRYALEVPREGCARVRKLVAQVKTDKDQLLEQPLPTPGGACGG